MDIDKLISAAFKRHHGKIGFPELCEMVEQAMLEEASKKISIEPVNMGNIAEGLFVLGAVAKVEAGGGNVNASSIMGIREKIANSLKDQNRKQGLYQSSVKGNVAGLSVSVKIRLEPPMFNPLFLPSQFGEDLLPTFKEVVSKKNKTWAELATRSEGGDEAAFAQLQEMHRIVLNKLTEVAGSSAAYWNSTGSGGWEDMLRALEGVENNKVALVADGVEGEDYTTADAWVELEKPVDGVTTTKGGKHHIVAEYSLKADSAQISQGGGVGGDRVIKRDDKGNLVSDKGGGVGVLAQRLEVYEDLLADPEAKAALEWYQEKDESGKFVNPRPASADTPERKRQYAENWNVMMRSISAALGKKVQQESGKQALLFSLGTMITGGAENIEMRYVDLAQSGRKAKVALPSSFPAYIRHIELESGVTQGNIEIFGREEVSQPLVKISGVNPLPETAAEFDAAKAGYDIQGSLNTIIKTLKSPPSEKAGQPKSDYPIAEQAASIFGQGGIDALGLQGAPSSSELKKYAKYQPPSDDPAEVAAYEEKRNAVMQKLESAIAQAPLDNVYDGVRAKLNSLLPKQGEVLLLLRWKLREKASRTYIEKRKGLVGVANYTKYLTELEAEVNKSVQTAIENIMKASAALQEAYSAAAEKK